MAVALAAALALAACGGSDSADNLIPDGGGTLPPAPEVSVSALAPVDLVPASDVQAETLTLGERFTRTIALTGSSLTVVLQTDGGSLVPFTFYSSDAALIAQGGGSPCGGSCSFSGLAAGNHYLDLAWGSATTAASLWVYDGTFDVGTTTAAGSPTLTPMTPGADVVITRKVVVGDNGTSYFSFERGENLSVQFSIGTPGVAYATMAGQIRGGSGSPILGGCNVTACDISGGTQWVLQVGNSGSAATWVDVTLTLAP
jgi:hypothetical protein